MAKAERGAKSAAIKEHLAANKEDSPKQVVEALKVKGLEVSRGLANSIKYGKPGKKKDSANKARRGIEPKAKSAVSGSESIRQYIAKHPNAMPKEIRIGLKQQGVKVSAGLVSNVKYTSGRKLAKRKRSTTPSVRVAARKTSPALSVEQLIDV